MSHTLESFNERLVTRFKKVLRDNASDKAFMLYVRTALGDAWVNKMMKN